MWDSIAPLGTSSAQDHAATNLAQHQREREEEKRLASERERLKEETERKKKDEEAKYVWF